MLRRRQLPPFQDLLQTAVNLRPDVQSKKHLAQGAHDSASEPLLRIIPTLNLTGQANTSTNIPSRNEGDRRVARPRAHVDDLRCRYTLRGQALA